MDFIRSAAPRLINILAVSELGLKSNIYKLVLTKLSDLK